MKMGIALIALGAILIFTGIGMVIYQMRRVSWNQPPARSMHLDKKGITLKTTYPGIVVIAIGAVLVLVAAGVSN
jgi:hypothetical protein